MRGKTSSTIQARTNPTVLVVDDERDLREVLCDVLNIGGIRVCVAASGREAIELARRQPPDLIVTDLRLGDCTGLDVIDDIRRDASATPAVVITGQQDPAVLAEASRHRLLEVMTKPLDVHRLRACVTQELQRQARTRRSDLRTRRFRRLARQANQERRHLRTRLASTCGDLARAYGKISAQLAAQQTLIAYQQDLLKARTDDDVFRTLFGLFVRRSGPVFGVAMVCDANAELQVAGRFGVPLPDDLPFCRHLAKPIIAQVLANPTCGTLDAGEEADLFDPAIRRYLPGLTLLAMPLIPSEGELIGLVILYRKGEQPFSRDDLDLTRLLGPSTAVVIRRND
ncbi:MAG: Response regulator receiver protein [Planctomycetes bacterium ADurb.Bin126]|nr:MAG: Response regulator receiver protein [Planctomycetes bacterium ADurb.Bin126]HQL73855.1 response regulator [Phycisphaerae bacterium]